MYVITEINNRLELKAYRSNVLPAQSEIVLLRFKFFLSIMSVFIPKFLPTLFHNFIVLAQNESGYSNEL